MSYKIVLQDSGNRCSREDAGCSGVRCRNRKREYQFERRMFGSNPEQLRSLAAWLLEQEVEEVVMESTAQYWKPVWEGGLRRGKYLATVDCATAIPNLSSSS